MSVSPAGRAARVLLVLSFITGLSWPRGLPAQEEHPLRGRDVAVFNLAGNVEVVSGSGSDVVVRVTRGGADAARLEVDVMEVDGREALVVRYPEDRVVYPEMGRGSRTEVRVREDGTFSGSEGSSGTHRVRISGSGDGLEAWADLRIAVPSGKDFTLRLAVGETDVTGVDGELSVNVGSGAIRLRDGAGEVNLDTGSGSVTVDGFQGQVAIDTGSGAVELNDIRGDEVEVDTGSGRVRGEGITAGSLGVDTGSGGIDLRAVSCPDLSLDTGSGSVEVELLDDVDDLMIDTGSGSVTVWAPASLGAQVELDTGSGGIDLDLPLEIRQVRRDYLRGVLGDGRGWIRVDTGSGAIKLLAR